MTFINVLGVEALALGHAEFVEHLSSAFTAHAKGSPDLLECKFAWQGGIGLQPGSETPLRGARRRGSTTG
jgi:hypothetical protein